MDRASRRLSTSSACPWIPSNTSTLALALVLALTLGSTGAGTGTTTGVGKTAAERTLPGSLPTECHSLSQQAQAAVQSATNLTRTYAQLLSENNTAMTKLKLSLAEQSRQASQSELQEQRCLEIVEQQKEKLSASQARVVAMEVQLFALVCGGQLWDRSIVEIYVP